MTMPDTLGHPGPISIALFFFFVAATLFVTYWAARKTKTTEDFYTAKGQISGLQNGFALAGDYMSAASFLGIVGMVMLSGFDGMIYLAGWIAGWPVLLFFVADPLRNLGKYTLADAVSFRMRERPVRIAIAFSTLSIVMLYMIAQMVGGGFLIKLMFGISYETALVLVGSAMVCYVLFGGMLATTWVQIIKAGLLLCGALALTLLGLKHFNFNPFSLFASAAERYGDTVLAPGPLTRIPWDVVSLGLSLVLGTAGLPHILMRFYTVPDARAARTSVLYASGIVGVFYICTFLIGFCCMMLIGRDTIQAIDKGGNISALLLAELLGGETFLGFISAVAFATILAVVAGLTLSGAATLSHDFWVSLFRKGKANPREQLIVARIATLALGIISIGLGIIFKGQNVAFMVGLAFAVAASSNFPALLLATFWRRATTPGVVTSIVVGTFTALALIALSPPVMVEILGYNEALFPLKNPGLVSIPLSFIAGIVVSLMTEDSNAERLFLTAQSRMHLGQTANEPNLKASSTRSNKETSPNRAKVSAPKKLAEKPKMPQTPMVSAKQQK